MWLNQTLASGMRPYSHFVGAEEAKEKTRAGSRSGATTFAGPQKHDAHFVNRRSIADIGVVIGQSTQLLYPGPATARAPLHARDHAGYLRRIAVGPIRVRLRARGSPGSGPHARYRALILPNVAMLSDEQCRQLRDYVRAGGALMGSFETSLYDENLKPRADSASPTCSASARRAMPSAPTATPTTRGLRSGRAPAHEVLAGFAGTHWLPGAENRVPLQPIDDPC